MYDTYPEESQLFKFNFFIIPSDCRFRFLSKKYVLKVFFFFQNSDGFMFVLLWFCCLHTALLFVWAQYDKCFDSEMLLYDNKFGRQTMNASSSRVHTRARAHAPLEIVLEYPITRFFKYKNNTGHTSGWTDGHTDGPTDIHTDGQPSFRNARTHLKSLLVKLRVLWHDRIGDGKRMG